MEYCNADIVSERPGYFFWNIFCCFIVDVQCVFCTDYCYSVFFVLVVKIFCICDDLREVCVCVED